jgi:CheY-like chemotaxis protein
MDGRENGRVILAVDDVQLHLDVIGRALRRLGFRVIEATNAQDAYDRARETHPEIILCDIRMKHRAEFDLVEKIAADPELANIPLLFITPSSSGTSI